MKSTLRVVNKCLLCCLIVYILLIQLMSSVFICRVECYKDFKKCLRRWIFFSPVYFWLEKNRYLFFTSNQREKYNNLCFTNVNKCHSHKCHETRFKKKFDFRTFLRSLETLAVLYYLNVRNNCFSFSRSCNGDRRRERDHCRHLHTHTHAHLVTFKFPVHLTCMFLHMWTCIEHTQRHRENMQTPNLYLFIIISYFHTDKQL